MAAAGSTPVPAMIRNCPACRNSAPSSCQSALAPFAGRAIFVTPHRYPHLVPSASSSRQPDLFAQTEPTRLTVTTLHHHMKRVLNGLGQVAVTGEAHDVKTRGGTTYLMLKERSSQVSVVITSTKQRWCHVRSGESVVVTGRLDTSQSSGRLSLMADAIVPTGEGAVAALIEQTRERMRADGLLDRTRRGLPLLPGCVVVVCGNDAAVKHDFQTVTDQRFPGFPVQYLTASQSSAESLLDGLQRALAVPGVDVVVLARGGGDSTQLLPYSDELLCRAIAASPVPVVTAIGHEIDRPLCDEVSDSRAPTPSVAATQVIPDRSVLQGGLDTCIQRCSRTVENRLSQLSVSMTHRRALLDGRPRLRLQMAVARLDSVRWADAVADTLAARRSALDAVRPSTAMTVRLVDTETRINTLRTQSRPPSTDRFHHRLAELRARADSFSPQQVLERGFAIVRNAATGAVLRNPADAQPGERLNITLAGGTVQVVVGPDADQRLF